MTSLLKSSGYFTMLTDHQGNNVALVDSTGTVVQRTAYYPYGAPWADDAAHHRLFSGKEWLTAHGLREYDFHARRYVPSIPRFTTPDPLAESHPDLSPYIYCGANPVNATDPAGMEWNINSWRDDDDLLHIDMTITGVVYNASQEKFNMNALASKIQEQIDDVFTLHGDGFKTTMKSNISVAKEAEYVKGDNHLFIVIDQDRLFESETQLAHADPSGLGIRIGTRLIRDMLRGKNQRSIAHEVGHTGGLWDTNDHRNDIRIDDLGTNLMTQIINLPQKTDINAAINLEFKQLLRITELYEDDMLNQHVRYKKAVIKQRK